MFRLFIGLRRFLINWIGWNKSKDLITNLRAQLKHAERQLYYEQLNIKAVNAKFENKLASQHKTILVARNALLLFAQTAPGQIAPPEAYRALSLVTSATSNETTEQVSEINSLRAENAQLRRAYNALERVVRTMDVQEIVQAKNQVADIKVSDARK